MAKRRDDIRDLGKAQIEPAQFISGQTKDPYYVPTQEPVQKAADDPSGLLSLSKSLATIQPTLRDLVGVVAADYHETQQQEAGLQMSQAANRDEFRKKIEAGEIELGESPWTPHYTGRAYLKRMAELDFPAALTKAYNENVDVRNTSEPATFNAWLDKFTGEYSDSVIYRREPGVDGTVNKTPAFSDTQLAKFYLPGLDAAKAHIQNTWMAEGRQRQERTAYETFGQNLLDTLRASVSEYNGELNGDPAHDRGGFNDMGFSFVTERFKQEFDEGLKFGLDKRKMNLAFAELVLAEADATKNSGVLVVLEKVKTPGGSLADLPEVRSKIFETQHKIAAQKYQDETMAWTREERNIQGDFETRKQRFDEGQQQIEIDRTRSMMRYDEEKKGWATKDHKQQVEIQGDSESAVIIKAIETSLKVGSSQRLNDPDVRAAFEWLRVNDPNRYMTMERYVQTSMRQRTDKSETPEGRFSYGQIVKDMNEHPKSFQANRIYEAFNAGLLTDKQVGQLTDDWRAIRTNLDHPYMQSHFFKGLMTKIDKSIEKDKFDELAIGKAREAQWNFRQDALAWLERHPNGSVDEFEGYVTKRFTPLLSEVNEGLKDSLTAKRGTRTITPPDTRTTFERKAPEFLGGKPAPKPYEVPAPLEVKPKERMTQEQVYSMLSDDDARVLDAETDLFENGLKSEREYRNMLRDRLEPIFGMQDRSIREMREFIDQQIARIKKTKGKK